MNGLHGVGGHETGSKPIAPAGEPQQLCFDCCFELAGWRAWLELIKTLTLFAFPRMRQARSSASWIGSGLRRALAGRRPADAHHLRFAQPRAPGLKVSDEFTLPLCRIHHRALPCAPTRSPGGRSTRSIRSRWHGDRERIAAGSRSIPAAPPRIQVNIPKPTAASGRGWRGDPQWVNSPRRPPIAAAQPLRPLFTAARERCGSEERLSSRDHRGRLQRPEKTT